MKINRKIMQKLSYVSLMISMYAFVLSTIGSCQKSTQYPHMNNDNSQYGDTKLDGLSWESEIHMRDAQGAHTAIANTLALDISLSHSGGDSSTSNSTSLTKTASDTSHDHTLASISSSQAKKSSLNNSSVNVEQELTASKVFPAYSEADHRAWFRALTMFMDHSEDKNELQAILREGQSKGYLTKAIWWGDKEYTPMHYAAQEGDLTVVAMLSEVYQVPLGITVGNYQKVPLHLAASRGRVHVVKYILSQDKSLQSACDTEGSGALHYATLGNYGMNNVEVVKYLVEDLSTNLKEKSGEFNLLYLATEADNLDMVGYLLEKCPALVHETAYGMSPFDYAEHIGASTIAAKIAGVAAASTSIRNLADSVLTKQRPSA